MSKYPKKIKPANRHTLHGRGNVKATKIGGKRVFYRTAKPAAAGKFGKYKRKQKIKMLKKLKKPVQDTTARANT